MDRRNAIITLSGVLATSALLGANARTANAQASGSLTPAEYKASTLDVGTYSKLSSQLALSQAGHAKVKEFAQFEIAEQTAIAQVLTDLSYPPAAPMNPQRAGLLQQLGAMRDPRAFDAAYVTAQIDGHRQLLSIQQTFLDSADADRDQQHVAVLARAVIQMHLTMLQELQGLLSA